ncbi:hypothetical protein EV127DRAFT_429063 [Xylaria flabelliformis]|nr:hypothetical protein EV127DRAFT_429063 [Xylaria flabelliformis]
MSRGHLARMVSFLYLLVFFVVILCWPARGLVYALCHVAYHLTQYTPHSLYLLLRATLYVGTITQRMHYHMHSPIYLHIGGNFVHDKAIVEYNYSRICSKTVVYRIQNS